MPALYPVSVAAEDYKVGDNVRWFSSTVPSSYIGKVVAISPKIYKVWVTWPIGDTVQHSPEELILVPKYQGMSVVQEDNGYDSYDKQQSAKIFGKMTPTPRDKSAAVIEDNFVRTVTAHEIIVGFKAKTEKLASDYATKLAKDIDEGITDCQEKKMTVIQAYDTMFEKYGMHVGDELLKQALIQRYQEK